MRIKTLATDLKLDLSTIEVIWEAKAQKRNSSVILRLSDGKAVEVWADGHVQVWTPDNKLLLETSISTITAVAEAGWLGDDNLSRVFDGEEVPNGETVWSGTMERSHHAHKVYLDRAFGKKV